MITVSPTPTTRTRAANHAQHAYALRDPYGAHPGRDTSSSSTCERPYRRTGTGSAWHAKSPPRSGRGDHMAPSCGRGTPRPQGGPGGASPRTASSCAYVTRSRREDRTRTHRGLSSAALPGLPSRPCSAFNRPEAVGTREGCLNRYSKRDSNPQPPGSKPVASARLGYWSLLPILTRRLNDCSRAPPVARVETKAGFEPAWVRVAACQLATHSLRHSPYARLRSVVAGVTSRGSSIELHKVWALFSRPVPTVIRVLATLGSGGGRIRTGVL